MESHLLQMRGLKQYQTFGKQQQKKVASFTDAWIETGLMRIELLGGTVASFTDAWIETIKVKETGTAEHVASFTDAWIET